MSGRGGTHYWCLRAWCWCSQWWRGCSRIRVLMISSLLMRDWVRHTSILYKRMHRIRYVFLVCMHVYIDDQQFVGEGLSEAQKHSIQTHAPNKVCFFFVCMISSFVCMHIDDLQFVLPCVIKLFSLYVCMCLMWVHVYMWVHVCLMWVHVCV